MQTKRRKRLFSKTKKKTTQVTVNFLVSQHRKLKALDALEDVSLQAYICCRVFPNPQTMNISDDELSPIVKGIIFDVGMLRAIAYH